MPAAIAIQNKRPVYQKNASIIRASNNPSPLRRVQANGENEGCSRQGIDKKLSSRAQRIRSGGGLLRVVESSFEPSYRGGRGTWSLQAAGS